MDTVTSPPASIAPALRKLYFARFGFAIAWAVLVTLTASTLSPVAATLLVLYPAVDLVAAVVDYRASRSSRPTPALYVNMALSLLAAIGLGIAATSGTSAVLVVWGVWAITAGAVQLIVALSRRALGGQWAMILSGGISVLAGLGFAMQGASPDASITSIAGYATLGGIFFLVSALRLGRATTGAQR